ncbi:hypothetical protein A2U01_0109704, partial [Trifolium medium]|nr:hypothetical protein [Trifolium medium]
MGLEDQWKGNNGSPDSSNIKSGKSSPQR